MRLRHLSLTLFGLLSIAAVSPVHAQVTAAPTLINFQGQLATPAGNPVPDGTYSIRFSLWDAVSAGTEKWNQTLATVAVKNGTFAVLLNTNTANLFNGNLWLEIKVGADAALAPRQQLVSVAFALKANSVPDGSITTASILDGTITAADLANGTLTGANIAAGTITADKFAANIFNPLAWLLGGNSGTNPASQFLGTTDAQPLVFRTDNTEKMRLLANGNVGIGTLTPAAKLHVSGGSLQLDGGQELFFGDDGQIRSLDNNHRILFRRADNKLELREFGDIIFSPGSTGTETAKVVMLGNGNVGIGTAAPGTLLDVAGTAQMTGFMLPTGAGANRVLTSDAAGLGTWNALTSLLGNNSITNAMIQSVDYSKITNAPVVNGWNLTGNAGTLPATNFLGTTDAQPLVLKANNHRALQLQYATIVINGNTLTGVNVLGGYELNSISASATGATIAGGGGMYFGQNSPNIVNAEYGTIGGGLRNTAGNNGSTVGGGIGNLANGVYSMVGGGGQNTASANFATVGGGSSNTAGGNTATVGGGLRNNASNIANTVGGGADNTASGNYATIGGGQVNRATGIQSTVPGGQFNTAAGSGSFAAGLRAKANHDGAFVWADSVFVDFASTAANEFNVRASGGTRIFSNATATTGVLLAAGNGSWSSASDRNLKANFRTVDTLSILEKLLAMPLTTWNYKANTDIRHIGVMAQDFFAAFGGLGLDDKHIDTVDADGVALAAIQGLNRKLEVSNTELKKENSELKARLEALELAVHRLTVQPK